MRLFRDNVIEKRKLEEALHENQVAKDTAEASSKVKSQFLANMSHELRTPLNAIIGFSELLQNQIFGPLQKQYRDYATIIHESGHHLLNLVSDILDIAKIEAGKFVLDFQDVDLTESVAYCVRLVKKPRRRTGHQAGDAAAGPGPHLLGRSARLPPDPAQSAFQCDQILPARRRSRNHARGSAPTDLILTVRDHGIGMPESLLARVGQPFEQAINDPVHAREGTGLGLSLVRALVDQHGGLLNIESREGIGTAVTCELPLTQAGRKAADAAA